MVFSCLSAVITHRNHFLRLYRINLFKLKFRQPINHCKRVLEAAKFEYGDKTKESITSQKRGSWNLWWIANSALKESKSATRLYSTGQTCCLLRLIKKNCLLKTFLEILMNQISLVFYSRANLKLHSISVTPKLVKKVVTNLDLLNASGPDCILVVVLRNCEPELSY